MPRYKDFTGQRFGKLTVTKALGTRNGRSLFEVICDCGNMKEISGNSLQSSNTASCGCAHSAALKTQNIKRRVLPSGQAAKNTLLSLYRKGAESRNLRHELTDLEMESLFQSECHYCGRAPLQVRNPRGLNGSFVYNGIDRVDNSVGYIVSNVVTCCKVCNRAKSDMKFSDWTYYLTSLAQHQTKGIK